MGYTVKAERTKNIIAAVLIVCGIILYISPLLLRLDNVITIDKKNYLSNSFDVYFNNYFIAVSGFKNLALPFWCCSIEGGLLLFTYIDVNFLNPLYSFILLFGPIKGTNIICCCYYLLAALSMFYLTRTVLKIDLLGSVYSSLVFAMSSYIVRTHAVGYITAHGNVLLPLLVAFFLKAVHSSKYIPMAALILGWFFLQCGLFVPVVALLLFLIVLMNSFLKEKNKIKFRSRYLIVFMVILILSVLYSMPKQMLLWEWVVKWAPADAIKTRGMTYSQIMMAGNSFRAFHQNIFVGPLRSNASSVYLGHLTPLLCLAAIIIYFKRLKKWAFILLLFIMIYYGPISPLDLNYMLWHLPLFNKIRVTTKYYVFIITFLVSMLSGYFFCILRRYLPDMWRNLAGGAIILFTYINLTVAHFPFFNEYGTKIQWPEEKFNFCQAKLINLHMGDESPLALLRFALLQKNIGVMNVFCHRVAGTVENKISPKYLIIPKYAFLSPSTKLIPVKNPGYTGEAFFLKNNNKAQLLSITPSRIEIKVSLKRADRLVINQNFSRWWYFSGGAVENYEKKLSIYLEEPGEYKVILRFKPWNFWAGMLISLISLVCSILVLKKGKKVKILV